MTQETEGEVPPAVKFLSQELGPLQWAPPPSVIARVEAARRGKMRLGLGLGLGALVAVAASVLTVAPGLYGIATVSTVLAVLLFAASVWLTGAARRAPPFPFAVFEEGVFVPATFENLPGLQKVGPARAVRRSRVKRFEDVRLPEGRAILLWTKTGTGGIVSGRVGDVDIPAGEVDPLLDGFKAALRAIGIQESQTAEREGGGEGGDGEAPTGAPNGGPPAP